MTTAKTLIHHVLKLGLENTGAIQSFFESTSPTTLELNSQDHHGDTLVHFAARAHALPLLHLLHQYQANMDDKLAWYVKVNVDLGTSNATLIQASLIFLGRQAIHEAIDDLSCVEYLIDVCHVDPNAMKRGDWTPVMIAALKGNLDIVQYLVEHGALLHLTSKDGRTPLHMAVQEGHTKVATYLASQYPDSMFIATNSGRLPVQMAAAMATGGPLAQTLLSQASATQVKWIISHEDKSGRTILEDAVVANQPDLVVSLIATHGADPTRHDALGRNVWHQAAMVGNVSMLKCLGQWPVLRPLLDTPDTWDCWTPLCFAAKHGHLDCVVYLLEMKVNSTTPDKLGRTAKDLASLWHHDDIVAILE
ncbi:unnamed protein product [Absidia cylindrospora]